MVKQKKSFLLRALLVATAIVTYTNLGAHAQDAPPNIEEMIQQFNLENAAELLANDEGGASEDEYGIKAYDKSKTQFDGVTSEMQVSYLKLSKEHGVEIPVLSTGTKNENTDFTVMLWFKIDASYGRIYAPEGAVS